MTLLRVFCVLVCFTSSVTALGLPPVSPFGPALCNWTVSPASLDVAPSATRPWYPSLSIAVQCMQSQPSYLTLAVPVGQGSGDLLTSPSFSVTTSLSDWTASVDRYGNIAVNPIVSGPNLTEPILLTLTGLDMSMIYGLSTIEVCEKYYPLPSCRSTQLIVMKTWLSPTFNWFAADNYYPSLSKTSSCANGICNVSLSWDANTGLSALQLRWPGGALSSLPLSTLQFIVALPLGVNVLSLQGVAQSPSPQTVTTQVIVTVTT